jgi:peptidoglycan/xylan/chitin deacetylase (PgdA/CDA1 family)
MIPLFIKRGIFGTAEALGGNALCRRMHRRSLTVLSYHSVITAGRSLEQGLYCTTASRRNFERHIDYVARRFTPLSAAALIRHLLGGERLPNNPVVITFDDGYRNNLTLAAEVLLKKGVPAIFHLATAYIGGRSILWPDEILLRVLDWPDAVLPSPFGPVELPLSDNAGRMRAARRISEECKPIPVAVRGEFLKLLRSKTPEIPSRFDPEAHEFMNWEEARSLVRSGFDLGSHTVSHPILSSLAPSEIAAELRDSREEIRSRTGHPCETLAYPNGLRSDYSNIVFEEAGNAGYRLAFTQEDWRADCVSPQFAIPRLGVAGQFPVSFFFARVSGLYGLLATARAADERAPDGPDSGLGRSAGNRGTGRGASRPHAHRTGAGDF